MTFPTRKIRTRWQKRKSNEHCRYITFNTFVNLNQQTTSRNVSIRDGVLSDLLGQMTLEKCRKCLLLQGENNNGRFVSRQNIYLVNQKITLTIIKIALKRLKGLFVRQKLKVNSQQQVSLKDSVYIRIFRFVSHVLSVKCEVV